MFYIFKVIISYFRKEGNKFYGNVTYRQINDNGKFFPYVDNRQQTYYNISKLVHKMKESLHAENNKIIYIKEYVYEQL